VKSSGKSERHFIVGREKEHRLLEGSQALSARPSDKSTVKVKTLERLEGSRKKYSPTFLDATRTV
jgi:hypothetical protein